MAPARRGYRTVSDKHSLPDVELGEEPLPGEMEMPVAEPELEGEHRGRLNRADDIAIPAHCYAEAPSAAIVLSQ
jgi:hypothetical protein